MMSPGSWVLEISKAQKQANENAPIGWEVGAPPPQPYFVICRHPRRVLLPSYVAVAVVVGLVTLSDIMTQCHGSCPLVEKGAHERSRPSVGM
jgi:hypothetical protein